MTTKNIKKINFFDRLARAKKKQFMASKNHKFFNFFIVFRHEKSFFFSFRDRFSFFINFYNKMHFYEKT